MDSLTKWHEQRKNWREPSPYTETRTSWREAGQCLPVNKDGIRGAPESEGSNWEGGSGAGEGVTVFLEQYQQGGEALVRKRAALELTAGREGEEWALGVPSPPDQAW